MPSATQDGDEPPSSHTCVSSPSASTVKASPVLVLVVQPKSSTPNVKPPRPESIIKPLEHVGFVNTSDFDGIVDISGFKAIGKGGFAAVFKGTLLTTGEPIAVKLPRNLPGPSHGSATRQLTREVEVLQAINGSGAGHPNIISLIDFRVNRKGKITFLAMPLRSLGSLNRTIARLVKEKKEFPNAIVWDTASQVARAILHINEKGYDHSDVKLENILVVEQDEQGFPTKVELIDFGLARHKSQTASLRAHYGGTQPYMPPERVPNPDPARRVTRLPEWFDFACAIKGDVHGLGVVIACMILVQYSPKPTWYPDMEALKLKIEDEKKYDLLTRMLEPDVKKRCTIVEVLSGLSDPPPPVYGPPVLDLDEWPLLATGNKRKGNRKPESAKGRGKKQRT